MTDKKGRRGAHADHNRKKKLSRRNLARRKHAYKKSLASIDKEMDREEDKEKMMEQT